MASKDDMLDGDEQAAPAKKAEGKKKGPMLLILIGLLVMIVTPAATWMVVRQSSAPSSEEGKAPKEPEAQPIVMAIDPLVVNISGTRMTRVLRIQVHLVLSEPRLQEVLTEMLSKLNTGSVISPESYRLVAEVICFLYHMDRKWAGEHKEIGRVIEK